MKKTLAKWLSAALCILLLCSFCVFAAAAKEPATYVSEETGTMAEELTDVRATVRVSDGDVTTEESTTFEDYPTDAPTAPEYPTNSGETSDGSATSGTCGSNLTWVLDENGTLTISGTGAMYNQQPWSNRLLFIKSVVIEDGVTSIGSSAFQYCSELASVSIPDSVTTIGSSAFYKCTALETVTFGENSQLTSIDNYAFYYCSNLATVTFGENSQLTSIGYGAFSGCTALTAVYITDLAAWCSIDFEESNSNPLYYAKNLYLNHEPVSELTIPDTITIIKKYAFCNCTCLTSVSIPDRVTSIGYNAFSSCSNLATVTFGENSQLTSIGDYAFRNCTSLTSITIPDSVTDIGESAFANTGFYNDESNWEDGLLYAGNFLIRAKTDISGACTVKEGTVGIMQGAFFNCTALESITIPDSVTSIGRDVFEDCSNLATVTFGENSQLESIGSYAFRSCSALTEITIPDSVTSIGYQAFSSCSNLATVTFGENSQLTSISSYAFAYCDSLTEITIPDSVTSIGSDAFASCDNLTTVTFGENSQLTSIGSDAFRSCTKLTTVTFGENSQLTSIGSDAFYNCDSLTSIHIPAGVTSISGSAFAECNALSGITVDSSNANYSSLDGVLYNKDKTKLICYPAGKPEASFTIPGSVTGVDSQVFTDCLVLQSILVEDSSQFYSSFDGALYNKEQTTLVLCPPGKTTIAIPDSVTQINYSAFRAAVSLTSVSFGENSQLTSIGGSAFASCNALTEITIPAGVTSIGDSAFASCNALTEITIPDSVTSIGYQAFSSCSNLATVTFGENSQLTSISSDAFYKCTALANIVIPDSVTSISERVFYNCTSLKSVTFGENSKLTRINDYAFAHCDSLTEITIPDSVTSIGYQAFSSCSNLATVTFGENSQLTSIGNDAFYYCTALTEISIPDSVTSIGNSAFSECNNLTTVTFSENSQLTSIGSSAFYDCDSLTAITIPDSVTSICNYAFYYCTKLTTVTFGENSQLKTIGSCAFYNCGALHEITIPDSVTNIDNYAFYNCGSLSRIVITNPDCGFYDSSATLPTHTIIIGASGSAAARYAEKYNRAFADISNGNIASGYCGKNLCWSLSATGVLEISGKGAMKDYSSYTNLPWYPYRRIIETVSLSSAVTDIGNYAFYDCTSLQTFVFNELTQVPENPDYEDSDLDNYYPPIEEPTTNIRPVTPGDPDVFDSDDTSKPQQRVGEAAYSLTTIGNYAFYNCSSLAVFNVPASVTAIGNHALQNCIALTEITIADSVISIGDYAFSSCKKLTSVTFGENSQLETIGRDAFSNCTALASITIPDSVTSIGDSAFYNCTALETVTFGENSQLTTIGYNAFYNCTALTEITIPDSVTSIESYAFYNCSALKNITLGKNSQLTTIHKQAFEKCNLLASVTVEEGNANYSALDGVLYNNEQTELILYPAGKPGTSFAIPDGVLTIAPNAFYNCDMLETIAIADSVTTIGESAFENCSKLTAVAFGENSKLTSIGNSAFHYCPSLASISLPGSVTTIGTSAFNSCTSLAAVALSDKITSIGASVFNGTAFYNDQNNWENDELYIGNYLIAVKKAKGAYVIKDGTKVIAGGAFFGCTALESISIPDTVIGIGSSAFSGCSSLTAITIPDNVTSIGDSAFYHCAALESISIPGSVTSIGNNAFSYCTSLASISIPEAVTIIGDSAFEDCRKLITIAFGENSQLTSIGEYAFRYCSVLASINIPGSVTSIGDRVFAYCDALTAITVDETNDAFVSEDGVLYNKDKTELICYPANKPAPSFDVPDTVTDIATHAFAGSNHLTGVDLPDTLTEIVYGTFVASSALSSIDIPDSVTSIGRDAFSNCTALASITIPDSMTSIGDYAFENCTKLATVIFGENSQLETISSYTFCNCTALANITIPDSVTSIGYYAFHNAPYLTILGYVDSYAQKYATSYRIPFLALDSDPFVELNCSSVTPTAEFTVFGSATPGYTVSVYCDSSLLGTGKAGSNGRYSMQLTLPDPENEKTYSLVAKITVGGEDYESEAVQITYKNDSGTLKSLRFTHSYYTYSITPETLNFSGPVVSIDSSVPMSFVIELNGKPENLNIVSTKDDNERKIMPAIYNEADGKWYASGWFDAYDHSYSPGTITLEYDGGKIIEVPFKAKFIVDPSGFVYEAVKSNVLAGVTATVMYKDENGNAVFWNADEYDQINPQITKADGYFCWFVPDGEWQVRFVKSGYTTAYSDWYTVPPEVKDLYIPMVSKSAPTVEYCNVYEDYAEVKFSKYMQIDTVNSDTVTFGAYTGTWEAVDKEVSGTDETVSYATTFRFTPDTAFSGDVAVSVSGAKSYANVENTKYTATVTIAEPIEALTVSASELSVEAGQNGTITLDAGTAAAGKTVTVTVVNATIASVVRTVTLDENGTAEIAVAANSFGTTTLQFALSGTALTAEAVLTVTPTTAVAEPEVTLGDVDNDGDITAADARTVLRAAVGLATLTEAEFEVADVDKDDTLTAGDARSILRCAVGLETFR